MEMHNQGSRHLSSSVPQRLHRFRLDQAGSQRCLRRSLSYRGLPYTGRRTAQLPMRTYRLSSDELKGLLMGEIHSFRFLNKNLNRELIGLLKKAKIDHSIDRDGTVHYSSDDEEVVENDLICSIRDKVFPSWKVLNCPSDWTARYKEYMSHNDIPFQEELSNGELWFLIPGKHRPHSWKLEDSTSATRKRKSGSLTPGR